MKRKIFIKWHAESAWGACKTEDQGITMYTGFSFN